MNKLQIVAVSDCPFYMGGPEPLVDMVWIGWAAMVVAMLAIHWFVRQEQDEHPTRLDDAKPLLKDFSCILEVLEHVRRIGPI